ncbi:MAG: hypothetical protein ACJ74Z_05150 [Bryobacteraceae bacterium]
MLGPADFPICSSFPNTNDFSNPQIGSRKFSVGKSILFEALDGAVDADDVGLRFALKPVDLRFFSSDDWFEAGNVPRAALKRS